MMIFGPAIYCKTSQLSLVEQGYKVINKALIDKRLWEDSKIWFEDTPSAPCLPESNNAYRNVFDICRSFHKHCCMVDCCMVDASWTSSDNPAGIGWLLFNPSGRCIVQGKASIDPTSTPLEAEAIALLMAVRELRKLGYHDVLMIGDCKVLFDDLQKIAGHQKAATRWINSLIATYVKDIAALSVDRCKLTFMHVKRSMVAEADCIAKLAREQNSNYIVSWQL
ncbi:uncharacterized protein LOC112089878 [Eutrema salsugineum]|uniref:uncharacterized protein LOC112089878 n=1 Tax=Eutrema salsugineum TaxID=72664 RepID=UPI000CED0C32|nr:uncharacterized protein LOC112089878 [Eutrema salsugineum]